jgi:aminoglycoside 6'-N-acetyltransferase
MTSAAFDPLAADDAVLRLLEAGDLDLTRAWRNDPDSRAWFHDGAAIEPEGHLAWFRAYLTRDDDYVFMVEIAGRPVAQVSLYDIRESSAEFGRLLVDPGARGGGLSHRVVALTLQAAERLGVDHLHLEVKKDNVRAIRAYEKAGFVADPDIAGHHGALVMRRSA